MLASALPFADNAVINAAEYDKFPSDAPACIPEVTAALILPPTPAGDRHPTALSEIHTLLENTLAPSLDRAQPSRVP